MRLCQLHEMAVPTEDLLSRTYYHGTPKEQFAKGIIDQGLDPNQSGIKYKDRPKAKLKPAEGRVYLTRDLEYALIYAGYEGYLFEFPGEQLVDIDPDEDTVGEFVHNAFRDELEDEELSRVLKLYAEEYLTDNQKRQVKSGEYDMWAHCGKKLNKKFPDWVKLRILHYSDKVHIAHYGPVYPNRCWLVQSQKEGAHYWPQVDEFMEERELVWESDE